MQGRVFATDSWVFVFDVGRCLGDYSGDERALSLREWRRGHQPALRRDASWNVQFESHSSISAFEDGGFRQGSDRPEILRHQSVLILYKSRDVQECSRARARRVHGANFLM